MKLLFNDVLRRGRENFPDRVAVTAADGTTWYKQYAADTVERKPSKVPDGNITYHESIVKKLPDPPKRKDRV